MQALIAMNNSNPKALDASAMLSAYFASQGIAYDLLGSDKLYDVVCSRERGESVTDKYNLAVVLGGDGTIIRCARYLAGSACPILGINFGHLGFLANDSAHGVVDLVSRALIGELHADSRTNLCIRVICEGEEDDMGNDAHEFFALNEAAVSRGVAGHIIELSVDVGDNKIADLSGDGLIVASATGSTAYSLAAGGPIVAPGFMGLIVQPLAPHTLTARTVLTNSNDIVRVGFDREEDRRSVKLFMDGDPIDLPGPVECIYVMRGMLPTTLLYADPDHFYNYTAKTFYEK